MKHFLSGLENICLLHQRLSREFSEGLMEKLEPTNFLSYACLNVATRYFTAHQIDPYSPSIPFKTNVDPKGILQTLVQNSNYFHGEDNEVLYYGMGADNQ